MRRSACKLLPTLGLRIEERDSAVALLRNEERDFALASLLLRFAKPRVVANVTCQATGRRENGIPSRSDDGKFWITGLRGGRWEVLVLIFLFRHSDDGLLGTLATA